MSAEKGTDPQIIKYLASVFKKAMETPKYQEFLKSKNLDIRPYYLSGEELAKRARTELEQIKKAMKGL